jgi:penicillin G amidase
MTAPAPSLRDRLQGRLPPPDASLLAPVGRQVEILRDRAGVPHVYAGSTADLYFGLGFATAQDRLWQLDRLRRRALGRQAEVLGPEYARSDLVHRLVGIEEIARAEAGRLDERTREIVTAYVAGINHHLEQVGASPATLPIEFDLLGYACPPFTVADVLAILRGMWWSLNGRLEGLVAAEAARLLPEGPLRALYLTP